jgi:hypothetical protein
LLPAVTLVSRVKPRYACGACGIEMHAFISGMGHDTYTQSLFLEGMGVFCSNAAENELLRCNLLPAVTVVSRVKPRY